jgi:IclR family mhp operon transcriptional activator
VKEISSQGHAAVKSIRALERGMRVLEALQTLGDCSLDTLHRHTGLDRATLLRVLKTFAELGYVRRTLGSGLYRTSVRLQALGRPAAASQALAEAAAPVLDRLCFDLYWPSDVAIFDDGAAQIVETSRTRSPLLVNRVMLDLRVDLLHAALGQAILAFQPPATRHAMLDDYGREVARRGVAPLPLEHVDRLLAETRARGYGIRFPGYFVEAVGATLSLSAIAVPILNASGHALGALNLVWAAGATPIPAMVERALGPLQAAAAEIAERLEPAPPTAPAGAGATA